MCVVAQPDTSNINLNAVNPTCGKFSSAIGAALFTAIIAHFTLLVISKIILDAMDAAFICFAIDRDNGITTSAEMHSVAKAMPGVIVAPVVVVGNSGGASQAAFLDDPKLTTALATEAWGNDGSAGNAYDYADVPVAKRV